MVSAWLLPNDVYRMGNQNEFSIFGSLFFIARTIHCLSIENAWGKREQFILFFGSLLMAAEMSVTASS